MMRAPYCTKLKYLKVQKRSSLTINVKSLEVSLPLWSIDDRMDAHQGKRTTQRYAAKNRGSGGFNTRLSKSSLLSSVVQPEHATNHPTKPQQPQLAEPTNQHTNTNQHHHTYTIDPANNKGLMEVEEESQREEGEER